MCILPIECRKGSSGRAELCPIESVLLIRAVDNNVAAALGLCVVSGLNITVIPAVAAFVSTMWILWAGRVLLSTCNYMGRGGGRGRGRGRGEQSVRATAER